MKFINLTKEKNKKLVLIRQKDIKAIKDIFIADRKVEDFLDDFPAQQFF